MEAKPTAYGSGNVSDVRWRHRSLCLCGERQPAVPLCRACRRPSITCRVAAAGSAVCRCVGQLNKICRRRHTRRFEKNDCLASAVGAEDFNALERTSRCVEGKGALLIAAKKRLALLSSDSIRLRLMHSR